ncbi:YppF family protein [Alteribacter aurantiacus]|uniref:YppF family protein n=1 Tax=Alteribacter aurantiacus TaxID=254410 RepID=UPI000406C794|nr:YppF family protein [Alteribacter aurantiacus]
MTLAVLIDFYRVRFNQSPTQANDLMDVLTWCYLSEFVSPNDYKRLLKELEQRGAYKPYCNEEPYPREKHIS